MCMLSSDNLLVCHPNEIDENWHLVKDQIKRATDRSDGSTDLDYVYQGIKEGVMQLWASDDMKMVAVTQITEYKTGEKYLTFVVCAGEDFDKYKPLREPIVEWSKRNGCLGDEFVGRPGWARKTKEYKPVSVLYRRQYGK